MKEKLQDYSRKAKLLAGVAFIALLLLVVAIVVILQDKPHRTEQYKSVNGSAGLVATISYDCTSSCDNKFDFNVYIFHEDGQLLATFRPDQEGKIHAALQEGNYVALIGKPIGKGKLFPQERVALKNGQELELKLHYK